MNDLPPRYTEETNIDLPTYNGTQGYIDLTYEIMTTTVAGLIVGIIAYIGYNHLVNITNKVVHKMEANAVDFLDLLNEPV